MSSALALQDYRDAVSLDAPFDPGPPAPAARIPALVEEVVAHLEREGAGARLRSLLRGAAALHDPRARLRALLTVREPAPLPASVEAKLDAILRAEREARGAVDPRTLPAFPLGAAGGRTRCALWQGDITALAADAIVNAANDELLGCFLPFHACIDNAIHAAAGPRLREDCARIMRLQSHPEPVGCAKATRAYHLPSRLVLHTVGPIVRGAISVADEDALASAYRACLDLSVQLAGVRSVALCAISTGVFGFPREPAARIALRTVAGWLEAHPDALDLVVFDVFAERDLAAYHSALAAEEAVR